jgi:sulfite exporter TauE/SafE/copper chaperone CopZ
MNKIKVDIKGMHCRSCELLVEDELKKIRNIKRVEVDSQNGTAEIAYEGQLTNKDIENAVVCAGYTLGKDEKPYFSKNPRDYRDLAIAGFIVLALFLAVKALGIFDLSLTSSDNYHSLPAVFLIGITAGFSTCMALVGGLVLGASAKYAKENPTASPLQKFKPHLLFNLGRIISYTILGAAIGFLGAFFQVSSFALGVIIITAGVIMLLLGAQLIEIFPFLKGFSLVLPKSLNQRLGLKEQSPAMMGAMTFFLPCGFTQAMQLFTITSGSALTGALTMGTFALGTTPGLLGVGGLTSVVKGTVARLFFKGAGIVVILFAVSNLSSGYNLIGVDVFGEMATVFGPPPTRVGIEANPKIQNGFQVINMDQIGNGYSPNNFVVRRGVPVRWIINSRNPNSCASSIVMQKYSIRKTLNPGENIIEFTPTEPGVIKFSCSMGMYGGTFYVK